MGEEQETVFLMLKGTEIAELEAAPAMVEHAPVVVSEMPEIVVILMELPCK